MSTRDPGVMTRDERQAEVSKLLAIGYLRFLVARKESQNPLADTAESEPSCGRTVNRPEDKPEEVT